MSDDDFEFVLEPGFYWWVVNDSVWPRYARLLREIFGKNAFTVRDWTHGPGEVAWVVLELHKPMMISAQLMGLPTRWEPGQTAYSVAAFGAPEDYWFDGLKNAAEKIKARVAEWAGFAHEFAMTAATGGTYLLNKAAMQQLKDISIDPGKYLAKKGEQLFWTVAGAVAVVTVGVLVYKKVVK